MGDPCAIGCPGFGRSRRTSAGVMPEIGVTAALSAGTVAAAVLLGTAAVAAAPLFTLRRLRRTDVPATLRVVE